MKNRIRLLLLMILGLVPSCSEHERDNYEEANPFEYCITPASHDKLQIATMNLQEFPINGNTTKQIVRWLISRMDLDVIALQEISSKGELTSLANQLKGWTGLFTPAASGSMSLAYLYKESEIEVVGSETEAILTKDSYAFPRPPFKIKIRHKSTGKEMYLINLHLKAMGDSESQNRRRDAATKLKNYVDTNYPNDPVVILGDFNDQISTSSNQIFSVFYNDKANYRFADLHIATGSSTYFSYPSWPSHIDHILITNELFDDVDTVKVYRPEICAPDYRSVVTDHRPVVVFFK